MHEFIRQFKRVSQIHALNNAICFGDKLTITYSALEERATELATILLQQGIGPGHLLAVSMSKSPEYVISLLASWMVGAAFLPIEPDLPESRKRLFLEESKPNLIVHEHLQIEYRHSDKQYNSNLAYIFFTSGSTGHPKGVLVPHVGIMNVIEQQIKLFQLNESSKSLFYLSIQFDASISDIGTTLLSGATLVIEENIPLTIALDLPSILRKHKITHVDLPPSLLKTLNPSDIPDTLETMIIGGEVCPIDTIRKWSNKVRLINVYGPTEATICTSMACCNAAFEHGSIGQPIENINYALFDESFKPAQTGELFISGIGLASGYLNNPSLTEKKFINLNNETYYRTGDWVKQEKNGDYIYLGRIDRQFKIRGQLIEPEEIERALCQHPLVSRAFVTYKKSESRNQLLAAVEAKNVTAPILQYFLKTLLPSWMIPDQIVIVEELPKNTNGKIDASKIQLWNSELPVSHENASNPIAHKLQHIWKKVLELPTLPSIDDHLFQNLGANSFDIIRLIVDAESEGFYFSLELLNHLPTIHDLSEWLSLNKELSVDVIPAHILKKECMQTNQMILPSASQGHQLFITGVTGFLGIHILGELMLRTDDSLIYCLVRASSADSAIERIKKAAIQYHIKQITNNMHRIRAIPGDICLPQFGLTDNDWNNLCEKTGQIYHCAAEVNMTKTFAELRSANLEGTKEIAKLAQSGASKRIFYMSTLSVFTATDLNTGVAMEDDDLERIRYVYGGYAQSKWAAEYFLRGSNLDVIVFRLGLITGNSMNGQCADYDYLTLFIKGLKEIGSLPQGAWDKIYFDATPVDYAAQAIVHISQHARQKCFHIANTQGFSLQMLVDGLNAQNVDVPFHCDKNWQMKPINNPFIAASYMALCRILSADNQPLERFRSMDLFQATSIKFDQKNTQGHLLDTDIVCPKADGNLLNTYLNWITYAT